MLPAGKNEKATTESWQSTVEGGLVIEKDKKEIFICKFEYFPDTVELDTELGYVPDQSQTNQFYG